MKKKTKTNELPPQNNLPRTLDVDALRLIRGGANHQANIKFGDVT